ncbi:unnamed protein product [Bursaphelenchus okinawaensis]|uniref:Uncharacterized protein n=1 Tax=Bursaphelenchus okinawaensis TaxID=465554 RepID=A0A811KXQ3_9BILA|nr:unnamed protein product [Bursaphelenchus okinawaensis]CAG9113392.1 unnamed protein product [Bursaphelenchus okinawaensis]
MWLISVVFVLLCFCFQPVTSVNCRDALTYLGGSPPDEYDNKLVLIMADDNSEEKVLTTFYCLFGHWKNVSTSVYICITVDSDLKCFDIRDGNEFDNYIIARHYGRQYCSNCITITDRKLKIDRIVLTSETTTTLVDKVGLGDVRSVIVDLFYRGLADNNIRFNGLRIDVDDATDQQFTDYFAKLLTKNTRKQIEYVYVTRYDVLPQFPYKYVYNPAWLQLLLILSKTLAVVGLMYLPMIMFIYIMFKTYVIHDWLRELLLYQWNLERNMLQQNAERDPLLE